MDGGSSSRDASATLETLRAKDLEGKVINVMMLSEDAVGAAVEVLRTINTASGSLEALFKEQMKEMADASNEVLERLMSLEASAAEIGQAKDAQRQMAAHVLEIVHTFIDDQRSLYKSLSDIANKEFRSGYRSGSDVLSSRNGDEAYEVLKTTQQCSIRWEKSIEQYYTLLSDTGRALAHTLTQCAGSGGDSGRREKSVEAEVKSSLNRTLRRIDAAHIVEKLQMPMTCTAKFQKRMEDEAARVKEEEEKRRREAEEAAEKAKKRGFFRRRKADQEEDERAADAKATTRPRPGTKVSKYEIQSSFREASSSLMETVTDFLHLTQAIWDAFHAVSTRCKRCFSKDRTGGARSRSSRANGGGEELPRSDTGRAIEAKLNTNEEKAKEVAVSLEREEKEQVREKENDATGGNRKPKKGGISRLEEALRDIETDEGGLENSDSDSDGLFDSDSDKGGSAGGEGKSAKVAPSKAGAERKHATKYEESSVSSSDDEATSAKPRAQRNIAESIRDSDVEGGKSDSDSDSSYENPFGTTRSSSEKKERAPRRESLAGGIVSGGQLSDDDDDGSEIVALKLDDDESSDSDEAENNSPLKDSSGGSSVASDLSGFDDSEEDDEEEKRKGRSKRGGQGAVGRGMEASRGGKVNKTNDSGDRGRRGKSLRGKNEAINKGEATRVHKHPLDEEMEASNISLDDTYGEKVEGLGGALPERGGRNKGGTTRKTANTVDVNPKKQAKKRSGCF